MAKGLSEKQKRFIDFYIETGNATEAARRAGYKGKNLNRVASENLTKLDGFVRERLTALEESRLANMQEINEFWTALIRGEGPFGLAEHRDRLKASELRAKVLGAFVERVEVAPADSTWFKA